MKGFFQELAEQRWDDHRYYHHSRINQSLHLVSSIAFVCVYVLLFVSPVAAALLGWLFAMISRQIGHFFFEPKGYDEANQATHEEKEGLKIGYNLRRKVILLSIFAAMPVALWINPTFFGIFEAPSDMRGFVDHLAQIWLCLGVGAVLFRTVHLFFLRGVRTGLVWLTKIITDPFHDIMLYHKAPLYVLRGELLEAAGPRSEPETQSLS